MISDYNVVHLPLIRMEGHPTRGLTIEHGVTRTEYEIKYAKYTERKLGELLASGYAKQIQVRLPEMDGVVTLAAIVDGAQASDFAGFCDNVDRYTYAPYGPGAQSFGYYCQTTLAWMFPHRDGPAFLFKRTVDARKYVERWVSYSSQLPVVSRNDWPPIPTEKKIVSEAVRLPPHAKRRIRRR